MPVEPVTRGLPGLFRFPSSCRTFRYRPVGVEVYVILSRGDRSMGYLPRLPSPDACRRCPRTPFLQGRFSDPPAIRFRTPNPGVIAQHPVSRCTCQWEVSVVGAVRERPGAVVSARLLCWTAPLPNGWRSWLKPDSAAVLRGGRAVHERPLQPCHRPGCGCVVVVCPNVGAALRGRPPSRCRTPNPGAITQHPVARAIRCSGGLPPARWGASRPL
jgi:hypothetical protein